MHPTLPTALLLAALVACTKGTSTDDTGEGPLVTYSDKDNDTILDLHEGWVDEDSEELPIDTDGDTKPDFMDPDSDDDGISDSREAGDADPLTLPIDSDNDGTADYRDLDSDDNCIPDADEGGNDPDEDGLGNWADLDDDGDGIKDYVEIGESCGQVDSDGDGTPDFRDADSDGDGVKDLYEAGTSAWEDEPRDTDGDGTPDYLDEDSDGDGISDRSEKGNADEPKDTDGDGDYDFADEDSDDDGLTDGEELSTWHTDPYASDSDGDGYSDGAEVAAETDPNDATDVISGVYVTVAERTSVEENFTFSLTVQLGDIAFLLDTTGSMSGTAQGMANEFSAIVTDLAKTLPDANYGMATYDDYAYGSFGSGQDRPFELRAQMTSDFSRVQTKMSSIPIHSGGDWEESTMEALYQGLTGAGYDQNCNKKFDSGTDVKPFLSASTDPFGGSGGQWYDSSVPDTGTGGGFGFRSYALPVIVYATDAPLRDPDNGYAGPGGCAVDAGFSEVVSAAGDLGAYLIGISVSGTAAVAQMQKLADATGSYADTDGDGMADDRLVFNWSGSSSALRTTIVNAIGDLVSSVQFSEVSLEIEGDDWGFVKDIEPDSYTLSGSTAGQEVDFAITFRGAVAASETDQIFKLTLNVVGDGTVLLDTYDIYVRVPGRSY